MPHADAIPPWYIWAYYISPFAYCLRGIVINEMTQDRWQQPSPTGQSIGDAGLEVGCLMYAVSTTAVCIAGSL